MEETELKNEIKFEPDSPTTQFPLSPSSLNHSESNDSDRQGRCSTQELSNCTMQDIKAEVHIAACIISSYKKYKNLDRIKYLNFF